MKRANLLAILTLPIIITIAGCQTQEISQPQEIPADAKLVCIFFDDGWQNQYDVALPILLQHGFKASFGIITGSIGTGEGIWEYFGEKEIKDLAEYGMDIACHTKTHPHLTELTDEQLYEEIIDSKKHLEKLGLEIRTFIYPYCEWDERVVGYVKEAGHTCARSCGWGEETPFDIRTTEPEAKYHVYSDPIINLDFKQFQAIVDQASRHTVICLCYHFISDTGHEETSTPVSSFVAQMRYLEESGFTIVLLPDLIE